MKILIPVIILIASVFIFMQDSDDIKVEEQYDKDDKINFYDRKG